MIEVHPIKPVQHLAVVNLRFRQFAVMVLVPFSQRGRPRIERKPPSRISAGRPRCHVNHLARWHRRRDDDAGETVHPPESFASGRIVARQLQRACDQQFLAATPLPDRRRGITAHRVGSRGFPNHPAGGAVKRRQKTVLVMVLVEDDFAINHNGRTAGAVFDVPKVFCHRGHNRSGRSCRKTQTTADRHTRAWRSPDSPVDESVRRAGPL